MVFDDEFYQDIVDKKNEFEMLMPSNCDMSTEGSISLNEEISYAEVASAINNAKFNKSYLNIPNEAMKNDNAKHILHRFCRAQPPATSPTPTPTGGLRWFYFHILPTATTTTATIQNSTFLRKNSNFLTSHGLIYDV